MYRIALGLVLYLAVSADAVFQNCDSQGGSYNNVTVSNCDPNSEICFFNRGENVSIEINFNLEKDVEKAQSVVNAVLRAVTLPFIISRPDACEASGLKCPMTKDDGPYNYKLDLMIPKILSKIYIKLKVELKDENNVTFACVLIPCKIN